MPKKPKPKFPVKIYLYDTLDPWQLIIKKDEPGYGQYKKAVMIGTVKTSMFYHRPRDFEISDYQTYDGDKAYEHYWYYKNYFDKKVSYTINMPLINFKQTFLSEELGSNANDDQENLLHLTVTILQDHYDVFHEKFDLDNADRIEDIMENCFYG